MLYIDTREMKRELHELIDSEWPSDIAAFREQVKEIVKRHKLPINREQYSMHLARLVASNNPSRAKKLVDCFGDRSATLAMELLMVGTKMAFKACLWAAFILFVIACYQWMTT